MNALAPVSTRIDPVVFHLEGWQSVGVSPSPRRHASPAQLWRSCQSAPVPCTAEPSTFPITAGNHCRCAVLLKWCAFLAVPSASSSRFAELSSGVLGWVACLLAVGWLAACWQHATVAFPWLWDAATPSVIQVFMFLGFLRLFYFKQK